MPESGTPPPPAPTQVSLQQRGELPVLCIDNRHATATIALQGAQLLNYTPRGQRPLIWLSERAGYRRGHSVRGGIPICWPWFGALERNPDDVRAMAIGGDLPAHGLVRARDWTLRAVRETDDATEVVLGFSTDHALQRSWPHAADLQLTVTVGRTLTLALTTRNAGQQPIALTQALHSYFAVSAIDEVQLTGFENTRCIDTLDDWRERRQSGAIDFHGETDRIHLDVPREVRLRDRGWQREIVLRATGSTSAVVWNPWADKARRLSQFAPEAWRGMVCIETANVLDDRVLLEPATERTLSLEIGCDD